MEIPRIGDANLGAAKNAVDLDRGFVAFNLCVAEVELDTTEDGGGSATFEVLTLYAAFAAAKDCYGIKHVAGIGGNLRSDGWRSQRAPDENHANGNDRNRPKIGEAHMGNAEGV